MLNYIEIDKKALAHNIKTLKSLVKNDVILCPCIKSNAYGHGLVETGKAFVEAGADWLSVNSVEEAVRLRKSGIEAVIYILGYVQALDLPQVVANEFRVVAYNMEMLNELEIQAKKQNKTPYIHIKVETGNNRQGIQPEELVIFAKTARAKGIEVEGLTTHFANIEDTTDHSYAQKQLKEFKYAIKFLEDSGVHIKIKHCSNSAATLLFKEANFNMVRPGIACYGMWPSRETYLSYTKEIGNAVDLRRALKWKTKVAQVKTIQKGECVGYGCTFKTGHKTKLAILPVGYYDGYDRGVKGGYVLISGQRAAIRGRICMNIIMVEVTDIDDVKINDEVVLIGEQGSEVITPEQFANWAGTINYEITTRINENMTRIFQ